MDIPRETTILRIGLLLYAASFFLAAISESVGPPSPMRGYQCAYLSLVMPLIEVSRLLRGYTLEIPMLEMLAILLAGLTNPVFVIATIGLMRRKDTRLVSIAKALPPLLIPFSWVVLRYEHFYPREGHFLWIIGMLVVLFSNKLAKALKA